MSELGRFQNARCNNKNVPMNLLCWIRDFFFPFNISQAKVFPYVMEVKPNVTAAWPLCSHLVHKEFLSLLRATWGNPPQFPLYCLITLQGTAVHGWCNFARRSCNKYGGKMTCKQWDWKPPELTRVSLSGGRHCASCLEEEVIRPTVCTRVFFCSKIFTNLKLFYTH